MSALQSLSRDEMIAKLMWSSGGSGYGICGIGAAFLWESQRPEPGQPDWPSIVTIQGPKEKYTDEELAELVAFSEEKTAEYDKIFRHRMGANLIVMDKLPEGRWWRKRMSWEIGPMISETLPEAIAFMNGQ